MAKRKVSGWCKVMLEEGKSITSQATQLKRLPGCLDDCETAITAAHHDFYQLRDLCSKTKPSTQDRINAAYLLGRAGFYYGKAAERAEARGRRREIARRRKRRR